MTSVDHGAAVRRAAGVLAANARRPPLRAAQGAFALAWLAEWAAVVGIGIVAYRDGGALAVGLVGLARALPAAFLGPLATPLADRLRREHVLAAVAVARAAMLGGVAVAVAADAVTAAYALFVAAGVVGVLYRPVHSALLPSLCRTAQELVGAHVARGLLDSVAFFLGPLLATALLAAGSTAGVFTAAAVLSALSAAAVLAVRYEPAPRDEPPAPPRVLADARAGLHAVLASPPLRTLFALAAVQTFLRGAFGVLVVVLALDLLGAPEATVGALTAAVGAGAVVASVVASVLAGSRHLAAWSGVGVALWGVPLVAAAGAPSVLAAGLLLAGLGVGNALVDIGLFTLPARLAPDAVLARVFGVLESVVAVSVGLGSLAAPLVIEAVGAREAFVVLGVLAPAAVLGAWSALRRLDVSMAERDARVALLAGVPMLAPLPMPAIEHLASCVEERTARRGDDVVVQGAGGDTFYLLVDGSVDVLHDDHLVRVLDAGGSFGEVALLREAPRTMTVRAREDLRLLQLRRRQFVAAVQGCAASREEAEALLAGMHHVPVPRRGKPGP